MKKLLKYLFVAVLFTSLNSCNKTNETPNKVNGDKAFEDFHTIKVKNCTEYSLKVEITFKDDPYNNPITFSRDFNSKEIYTLPIYAKEIIEPNFSIGGISVAVNNKKDTEYEINGKNIRITIYREDIKTDCDDNVTDELTIMEPTVAYTLEMK